MEQEYNFALEKELQFTKDGDFAHTATLSFSTPGMAVYDELQVLSQLTMSAMMDARKFANEDDKAPDAGATEGEGDLDANAIKIMLLASQVKMSDIACAFRAIAVKTCELDTGVKIKDAHFGKLSPAEFNDCMFGYIVNFIVPSLF